MSGIHDGVPEAGAALPHIAFGTLFPVPGGAGPASNGPGNFQTCLIRSCSVSARVSCVPVGTRGLPVLLDVLQRWKNTLRPVPPRRKAVRRRTRPNVQFRRCLCSCLSLRCRRPSLRSSGSTCRVVFVACSGGPVGGRDGRRASVTRFTHSCCGYARDSHRQACADSSWNIGDEDVGPDAGQDVVALAGGADPAGTASTGPVACVRSCVCLHPGPSH